MDAPSLRDASTKLNRLFIQQRAGQSAKLGAHVSRNTYLAFGAASKCQLELWL